MPEFQQKQASERSVTDEVTQEHPVPAAEVQVDPAAIDDLLDEIDGVLEENAEEFVKGYIQSGGQ